MIQLNPWTKYIEDMIIPLWVTLICLYMFLVHVNTLGFSVCVIDKTALEVVGVFSI